MEGGRHVNGGVCGGGQGQERELLPSCETGKIKYKSCEDKNASSEDFKAYKEAENGR